MERLNQWLTLIANLGVLAGIAFLAYEIRLNTNAIQSQTRANLFSGAQEELWKNMEYPEITINLGTHNRELTIDEKVRLDAWLTASMRANEFAWLEYQDGNLDEDQWIGNQEVIRLILGSNRTRRWWTEIASPAFHADFVTVVNDLVLEQPEHNYVDKVLSIK